MKIRQVIDFYENKKDTPCPLTKALIIAGYQQERGGYIDLAYKEGVNVDYRNAEPTQWWHLIEAYCKRLDGERVFPYSVRCGELYFWMAEVSGCFEKSELEALAKDAIEVSQKVKRREKNLPPLKTAEGNKLIRKRCFYRIKECVENAQAIEDDKQIP